MIGYVNCNLERLSIHYIGNKLNDEGMVLSDSSIDIGDTLVRDILVRYFLLPFEKVNELYHFFHVNDLALNEVFNFCKEIFADASTFHDNSRQLAKYLFEVSGHPQIKSGELYVAYLSNVIIEGEETDAIGLFKSESKETYLKISPQGDNFNWHYEQEGINISKLDKGCLVFNLGMEDGYKVAVIDNTNRGQQAVYWKDDFLKLKVRNDNYHQTNNVLGIYKNFVTQKIDKDFEVSKADKIDLLNRSMKYFKENENFNIDEFSNEVIGNEQGIASFLKYKKDYEEEFEAPIPDTFDINAAAVKKQTRVYKSVLKLDKNFHIYIHGNKELIEKGFDEGKNMNYYKVYFKDEQ